MKYLVELFLSTLIFSLTPLLTNDFSPNNKQFCYIYIYNSLFIMKNWTRTVSDQVLIPHCPKPNLIEIGEGGDKRKSILGVK